MVTTVRSGHGGEELNVEFKATIHMEISAFQKLAKKQFKGVYWLSEKPVDTEGGDSNKPAGSAQGGLPFAVYLINDEVNSMDYVSKTLEQACSLPASEANAAMLFVHNQGKGVVFEARTEAEAVEVQTQLQQAGLTSEVKRVEG